MVALYLFCLGIGGVLLAASFFAHAEGVDDLGDAGWQQLFSLRNLTYFLFVFGAIGSSIAFLRGGKPGITTLLISAGAGLVMAALAHNVFGYVRRTDTSEIAPDSSLVGQAARVTLPVGSAGIGKVELTIGGQRVELLARPFGTERGDAGELENGSEVVIVEMVGGTAFVSRVSLDE
jgi:hypothetical protein